MSRQPTSSAYGNYDGGADVARVKRLRWWLVVGVLIVSFDFARVTVDALSSRGESAHAAIATPAPPVDASQAARTAAGSAIPSPNDASRAPAYAAAQADADVDTNNREHPTPDEAGDSPYMHPALWQGQITVHYGLKAWRWASQLPRRLEDSLAEVWMPVKALDDRTEAAQRDGLQTRSERIPSIAQEERPSSAPPAQLVLRNAIASGNDVHFLVNERAFSLAPGETIELTGRRWLVRFHRGGKFGDAAYAIWPGSYEFSVNSGGWDLVRQWH